MNDVIMPCSNCRQTTSLNEDFYRQETVELKKKSLEQQVFELQLEKSLINARILVLEKMLNVANSRPLTTEDFSVVEEKKI